MPEELENGTQVWLSDVRPVPFVLRSACDRSISHRLATATRVGRSRQALHPGSDLLLENIDVSKEHGVIEVWEDDSGWTVNVIDYASQDGYTHRTTVDEQPVPPNGLKIAPGAVIRFGWSALWILEKSSLQQRSEFARKPPNPDLQISKFEGMQSGRDIVKVKVETAACRSTLFRCPDWCSLVQVLLEFMNMPDEPPCADYIEVLDECGAPVTSKLVTTVEEMDDFDVQDLLIYVEVGVWIKMRLSSDLLLLAPLVRRNQEGDPELEEFTSEQLAAIRDPTDKHKMKKLSTGLVAKTTVGKALGIL